MSDLNVAVSPETPKDLSAIESMTELAFGPGRYARTAFRLREGVPHDPELSFVACAGEKLVGSVRLTSISIGSEPALLLGPLVVSPEHKNTGIGALLMRTAVNAAKENAHRLIILVGDEPYYGRFGFQKVPQGQILLPGPADPQRILACPLIDGEMQKYSGMAQSA